MRTLTNWSGFAWDDLICLFLALLKQLLGAICLFFHVFLGFSN